MAELLTGHGFVAAAEEAAELRAAAGGDRERLDALVARRLTGEPLEWIVGAIDFCGLRVTVQPGVYVPRWQSEALAERAAARLPATGVAVDLCTGTGAIAAVLAARHPGARVVATDVDERAAACARTNGVDARHGDLFAPLGAELDGGVDVVVGVVPYVPTAELGLLHRDTLAFESAGPYDGGPDGLGIVRRAVAGARRVLRPGGALLLELGGEQGDTVIAELRAGGWTAVGALHDEDGDPRGVEATAP